MEDNDADSFIERMKANEERLKHIETANQIEHEIQNSIALPLIIEVAQKQADEALSELAIVDPSDFKKIIALQGKVYCGKMLIQTLVAIRKRGAFASQEILRDTELEELQDGEEIG